MRELLLSLPFLATPALASGPGEHHPGVPADLDGGVSTYDLFEASVAHVDLDGCPAEFDPEVVFYRMTLNNEMANVFVLACEGDQILRTRRRFPAALRPQERARRN